MSMYWCIPCTFESCFGYRYSLCSKISCRSCQRRQSRSVACMWCSCPSLNCPYRHLRLSKMFNINILKSFKLLRALPFLFISTQMGIFEDLRYGSQSIVSSGHRYIFASKYLHTSPLLQSILYEYKNKYTKTSFL